MYSKNGMFGMTVREVAMGLMGLVGAMGIILLTYYAFTPSKKVIQNSDMNNQIYGSSGAGTKFKDTLTSY